MRNTAKPCIDGASAPSLMRCENAQGTDRDIPKPEDPRKTIRARHSLVKQTAQCAPAVGGGNKAERDDSARIDTAPLAWSAHIMQHRAQSSHRRSQISRIVASYAARLAEFLRHRPAPLIFRHCRCIMRHSPQSAPQPIRPVSSIIWASVKAPLVSMPSRSRAQTFLITNSLDSPLHTLSCTAE